MRRLGGAAPPGMTPSPLPPRTRPAPVPCRPPAQYDDSPEALAAALDALLEDPEFLDAVADEARRRRPPPFLGPGAWAGEGREAGGTPPSGCRQLRGGLWAAAGALSEDQRARRHGPPQGAGAASPCLPPHPTPNTPHPHPPTHPHPHPQVLFSEYESSLETANEQLDQLRNQLLVDDVRKKGP
jgi:hypothetical protein